jgi:hypothetical protein
MLRGKVVKEARIQIDLRACHPERSEGTLPVQRTKLRSFASLRTGSAKDLLA